MQWQFHIRDRIYSSSIIKGVDDVHILCICSIFKAPPGFIAITNPFDFSSFWVMKCITVSRLTNSKSLEIEHFWYMAIELNTCEHHQTQTHYLAYIVYYTLAPTNRFSAVRTSIMLWKVYHNRTLSDATLMMRKGHALRWAPVTW